MALPLAPFGRSLSRLVLAVAVAAASLFAVPAVQAQVYGGQAYQFGFPGSNYGNFGRSTTVFEAGFNAGGGANFLGCAGIGVFDYLKTTFNAQAIIDQLKNYMQTMLAKTLLTTIMSVPQVAAIFDTLNAFGNAKFELFQQSCDLSSIRKDAKDMFLRRCKDGGKNVSQCEKEWGDGSSNIFSKFTQALGGLVCSRENVQNTVRKTMCGENASCPLLGLIPQVRLNLSGSTGLNCGGGTYGQKDPMMPIQNMMSAAVEGGAAPIMTALQNGFDQIFGSLSRSQIKQAVEETEDACNQDADCGAGSPGGSASLAPARGYQPFLLAEKPIYAVSFGQAESGRGGDDKLVKKFKAYLNCDPANIKALKKVNRFMQAVAARGGPTPGTFQSQSLDNYMNKPMLSEAQGALAEVYKADAQALAQIMDAAIKCSLNTVDFMDVSTAAMLNEEVDGFGTRRQYNKAASMFWGLLATRSVLRFTIAELNYVMAKLNSREPEKIETKGTENDPDKNKKGKENDDAAVGIKETKDSVDKIKESLKEQLRALDDRINTSRDFANIMNRRQNQLRSSQQQSGYGFGEGAGFSY